MARSTFPRDRFDDLPDPSGRVGAHRAENPRLRGWIVFFWAAIATLVLIIAGIFATLVVSGRISLGPDDVATPVPTVEVTTPAVIDTSYSIVVLNGTADEGLAGALRDQIVAAGWPGDGVETGDSDTTDFGQTTVFYLRETDLAAAEGLAQTIGEAQVAQSDFLQPTDDPDTPDDESAVKRLIVVIGVDRAAGQASASPAP
ncbi:LytR C-terminal domain-containing protein [Microbacterium sp. VKM Ac-2923]|uniref:LytR C-terminal domain-containing protein n=1 Tax=Microbacterium sp. VKM Ac-2923 TaxID=2929476 RepID=UPI001FB3E03F|nr:LytR C-terminal domain-containing protein [Microbacterium sp. VKM Ac-2923]MCJ1708752.1 LytR C-terminal domain-containing protein [Microbacterium sp. VKM Ac-2923]